MIIAITQADSVAMVREYRPATEKTYLAPPAGYVEPGEEPADAATRELCEETGATGRNWRLVARLDPLPGYIDSPAHIFPSDIVGSTLDTSGGTERSVVALPRWAVREAIARGDITEMQAVSAFLLADAVSQAHAPRGQVGHENT